MADVTLRLFGPPAIRLRGSDVAMRPERRFQLLAYLGARQNWASRDELAHLFWSEQDNAGARRNLRWVLHSLHEIGPIEGLEAERERVRLVLDTDLAAFERALAEQQWDEAVKCYGGEFLQGLDHGAAGPFSHWSGAVRSRTADGFRNAALKWIGQNRDAYTEHDALTRRLLERDPFDEQTLVIALQALVATDQAALAQRRYREFAQRLLSEMGLEPGAELRALARRWATPAPRSPVHSEPAPGAPGDTSFIGRTEELARLEALLAEPGCRLITIVGPGGIGKSRLAGEFAARRAAAAPVALESLSLPMQIAPAVARALALPAAADVDAEAAVAAHLSERAALLVLDNFEHLIDGAKVISNWLNACPLLQVVVTSRERLELEQERIFVLEGLAGPRPGASLVDTAGADAVRLFVERALRSKPAFDFAHERAGVEQIVALVEGLPLALELAAVWTRLLPCTAIASDLRAGFELLTGADEARRTEHQSIRASLEHSWGLLLPRESDLLARLSVFRGNFALTAAREVADATLPALGSLADKSLLRSSDQGRFSLHPLVLQFAAEKLRATGAALVATQARHAAYYLGQLAQAEQEVLRGQQTLASIEPEIDNCMTAWRWAIDAARLDLLEPASDAWKLFFETRGRMREGLDAYEALAKAPVFELASHRLRAQVERGRAIFLMRLGDRAEAERRAHEALRHYRGARDAAGVLACLNQLGMLAWQRGNFARAQTYFREGSKRVDPDSRDAWKFVCNLALATQSSGDYVQAHALFEKAALIARRRVDRSDLAATLNNLGNLCIALGQKEDARRHLLEAIQLAQETGGRLGLPYALINLAIIEIELGRLEPARAYVEQAFDIVRAGADRQVEPMCWYTLARIESTAGNFTRARALLSEAARIALSSGNAPNMVEVALWAAETQARQGAHAHAAVMLAAIVDHPNAALTSRTAARSQLDALGAQLDAAALANAQAQSQGLTLPLLMARVIIAAPDQAATVLSSQSVTDDPSLAPIPAPESRPTVA